MPAIETEELTKDYQIGFWRPKPYRALDRLTLSVEEGVETIDQLDWLRAEGCNEVQGFLFSAARPAAEVDELLEKFSRRASKAA